MLRKGEDEHMPLTMAKTGEECTIKKLEVNPKQDVSWKALVLWLAQS